MLKKIYKLLKKLVMSFFILYGYNVLVPAKAIIPINIITLSLVMLLSPLILLTLIAIKILIY